VDAGTPAPAPLAGADASLVATAPGAAGTPAPTASGLAPAGAAIAPPPAAAVEPAPAREDVAPLRRRKLRRATRPSSPVVPQRAPYPEEHAAYLPLYVPLVLMPPTRITPTETAAEALIQRHVRVSSYQSLQEMLDEASRQWWEQPLPAPALWDHHSAIEREMEAMRESLRLELAVENRTRDPFRAANSRGGYVTACYTAEDAARIRAIDRAWFEAFVANWSDSGMFDMPQLRASFEQDTATNSMPCA
jgi:hypothetical protein